VFGKQEIFFHFKLLLRDIFIKYQKKKKKNIKLEGYFNNILK